jgi:hypothetical protein
MHLLKITLWREDDPTGTHHRFSNEGSNLKIEGEGDTSGTV